MELLTNFKQSDSPHISNQFHEWRHHHQFVNTYVPNQLLVECFVKYLLAPIIEDVAKGGFMAKEKFISRAQYLDLVYTQLGTLYDKISNTLRPSKKISPPPGKESHAFDGIIGSSSSHSMSKPFGISLISPKKNSPSHTHVASASKIKSISSDKGKSQQKPRSKKKGKGKKNKYSSLQDKQTNSSYDEK